uniref:Myosin motor domain-containing protein n=1 Tax=Ascaris lumbricoides TaxID=6252 RepID=A0A0M3I293_ASCLU
MPNCRLHYFNLCKQCFRSNHCFVFFSFFLTFVDIAISTLTAPLNFITIETISDLVVSTGALNMLSEKGYDVLYEVENRDIYFGILHIMHLHYAQNVEENDRLVSWQQQGGCLLSSAIGDLNGPLPVHNLLSNLTVKTKQAKCKNARFLRTRKAQKQMMRPI